MKQVLTRLQRLINVAVFILCVASGSAQDNSGCLTKYQLFKMQSSSLDDIRMFLNNENWSFNGAKSNQSFNYLDYQINYNIVSWEKSSYSDGGNITLYNSTGKSNIVIYQSNSLCFSGLLKSFTLTKGKTIVDQDKLVTIFKENPVTVEFREYKNDYSSSKFSILVYNTAALYQDIQILKDQGIAGGSGDQGKLNGNPNSDSYTGNSGSGGGSGLTISRGLQGRKITRFPSYEEDFSENAKVAVDIKVDLNGNVISASIQPRGTTTINASMKAIALKNARQLRFNTDEEGAAEQQGTIILSFRVKE